MYPFRTVLVLGLAACSGDDDVRDSRPVDETANDTGPVVEPDPNPEVGTVDCDPGVPFVLDEPAVCRGFVAVNFRIDDSANRQFTAGDYLAWMGGFRFDAETRIMDTVTQWSEPFPLVWDDGPWTTGEHEPADATADDAVWGVTAFFDLAAANQDPQTIEYGAIRNSDPSGSYGQWIWSRSFDGNGSFEVGSADDGQQVDATTLHLPAYGDVDVRISIDSAAVQALDRDDNGQPDFPTWDPADGIRIKSSRWDWIEAPATANLDNSQHTLVLSDLVDADVLKTGLMESGTTLQFIVVLVVNDGGLEYRDGPLGILEGVSAELSVAGGPWMPASLATLDSGNAIVLVP